MRHLRIDYIAVFIVLLGGSVHAIVTVNFCCRINRPLLIRQQGFVDSTTKSNRYRVRTRASISGICLLSNAEILTSRVQNHSW